MSTKNGYPEVSIIAGSDSDRPIIDKSEMLDILNAIGISWTLSYASAHRNDADLTEFCQNSVVNGVKLFIGIASMAAALPGGIAAKIECDLPVIGVPLVASDNITDGMDALMAMIRLPPGVPVMVVGIGKPGLKNAALAAAQIIALSDETGKTKEKLKEYLSSKKKPAIFNVESSPK